MTYPNQTTPHDIEPWASASLKLRAEPDCDPRGRWLTRLRTVRAGCATGGGRRECGVEAFGREGAELAEEWAGGDAGLPRAHPDHDLTAEDVVGKRLDQGAVATFPDLLRTVVTASRP